MHVPDNLPRIFEDTASLTCLVEDDVVLVAFNCLLVQEPYVSLEAHQPNFMTDHVMAV